MDSYVVRIYRRDRHKAHDLVGRVEIVAHEEERSFGSFEELRDILIATGSGKRSGKRKPDVERKIGGSE